MNEQGDTPPTDEAPAALPKSRKGRSFLRDCLAIFSSSILHSVTMVIVGVLAYRIWGPSALGQIRVAMSTSGLFQTVGDIGMRKVLPYMIGREGHAPARVAGLAVTLWAITSTVIVLMCGSLFLIPGLLQTPWWWGLLATAQIPLALFMSYARGIALGIERISFFAHIVWVRNPIILALVVLFGLVLGLSDGEHAYLRIVAALAAYVVVTIYCWMFIIKNTGIQFGWDAKLLRSMFVRGVTFAAGGLLMQLNYTVDIMLLGVVAFGVPSADIADYSTGAAIANFLWQMPIAIGHVLVSRGVRTKDPAAFARMTCRLVRVSTILAIPAGLALGVVGTFLFPVLYAHEGHESRVHIFMWFIMPGVIAFFAARMFESDLISRNKPMVVTRVMAFVVLFNIILNVYLIPKDWFLGGARGAAVASMFTYIFGTIALTRAYSKVTGLSIREIVTPRKSDFRFKLGPLSQIMRRKAKAQAEDTIDEE